MENFNVYKAHMKFLGMHELHGFKMFLVDDYPYIVRSKSFSDKVVAELFRITDSTTEQTIHQLEIDAGYIFNEIDIAEQKFGIYLFDKPDPAHRPISSGDWALFKKEGGF